MSGIGSHDAVGGRHRRDRGRLGRLGEATAARARPRACVPRRARPRLGFVARAPNRRRWRVELHVPARARREPLRPSASAASTAATFRARRGARGSAPARTARGRIRAPADDRRGRRGRERPRRPVLRHELPRRPRTDGRAAAGARERAGATPSRRRPRRRARRDPRRRRDDARPGGVRAARELQRASGPTLRPALGDQQDA